MTRASRGRDIAVKPAGKMLAERIVAGPLAADPEVARRKVDEWLSGLGRTAGAKAIAKLLASHPPLRGLIEALADGSPFLWELASREPDRLLTILQSDPDERFERLLADAAAQSDVAEEEAAVSRLLRRAKAEAALLIALADIGGVWELAQITGALTRFADAAISCCLRFLLRQAAESGKFKLADPQDPEKGCGYVVLAMGKMGGLELNYSSDIDLICLFDPEAAALPPDGEAAQFYIRLTRSLTRMLQERSVDGYVFRVDLRLRPDPGLTQIALSTASALDYYESVGQNWERAAMIKARPCAGDIALGEEFLRQLSPFIWRKYLDYAAIADVQAMKQQIHAYRGHDEIAIEGHNVKLGRGGIREIEFFAQTQQLIAGGRHAELRGRRTLDTLETLCAGGWIDAPTRDDLDAAYRFLRTVEHRLQMVNDEQTHTLPAEREDIEAFARFLGFRDRDAFAQVLTRHLRAVQARYADLFEENAAGANAGNGLKLVFPQDSDDRQTLELLLAMGFRQPLEASATVRRWLSRSYRALRGDLGHTHIEALAPVLLQHLARGPDCDSALKALDRLLANLHGGARLLSLLRQHQDLVALIALILGTAPRLADILGQHPHVMDALIDPTFFGALPDEKGLAAGLDRTIGEAASYEDFLDRVRLFKQEQLFLIGTRILSGTITARQAGEAFACLAETVTRRVQSTVERLFAESHGRVGGQQTALLAMGKLGGREMTAASDLDLILIYDLDPERSESDGARPLQGAHYFARLTQRLVAALTVPTNYGALYPVDMRLRPSGRSGPVASHIEAFESYQRSEAWTWEHMALTRARVMSESPVFAERAARVIRDVLCQERDAELIAADVVEMRRAIASEKDEGDRWDLKYAAGGLIDMEFIAQYLQLVHAAAHPGILDTSTAAVFDKALRLGVISLADAEVLRPAIRLHHDLTQILRLCLVGPFDRKTAGAQFLGLLARAADLPDFAMLDAHLAETQARVRACFTRILGAAP